MGRPDFDEKGGEFVKSFTLQYSIDKETWTPYKSHGKIKVSVCMYIGWFSPSDFHTKKVNLNW